ncbi:hypothetical protein PG996_008827 [Apiospora saccharicola]|uniref:DUF7025 domain-containing protein n=1 Tax=Apiospora saccharicola TaxID=335842 RepID=A0ABR1V1M7_9PEZI
MATSTSLPDAQAPEPGDLDCSAVRKSHGSRDDGCDILPEVRYCNWEDFMNSFSPDEPSYAIEALMPGTVLEREFSDEALRRHHKGVKGYEEEPEDIVIRVRQQRRSIERIRIRSKPLLELFTRLTEYSWGDNPRTFTQPFKYMVHYQETFQQELERLRNKALQCNASAKSQHQDPKIQAEFEEVETLRHLECYVKFAEDNIMHHLHDVRRLGPTERVMVRYDHLWYFFRPGDLIFVSPMTLSDAVRDMVDKQVIHETGLGHESSMQQTIWKVHGTWSFHKDGGIKDSDDVPRFRVYAYYLDFDGTSYSAVDLQLDINQYTGDREVRELPFYPLRFPERVEELKAKSKQVGQLYTKFLKERHITYNGWSLVTDPMGVPITDLVSGNLRKQVQPVHIEGDVIIDFLEAFNSDPSHRSPFFSKHEYDSSDTVSYLALTHPFAAWSDPQRSKLIELKKEFLFQTNELDDIERENYWKTDAYLDPVASSKGRVEILEEYLILLPRRLFAYALAARIFLPIDVRFLKSVTVQENAINQLQLPDSHKSMLKAAVESHLRKQSVEKQLKNPWRPVTNAGFH